MTPGPPDAGNPALTDPLLLDGASARAPLPGEDDELDQARADRAWSYRYTDPERMRQALALLVDGPRRCVLLAFLAWREQRLADALTLTGALLDDEGLDPLWRARGLGVQVAVLGELGLVEEAFAAQLDELETARLSGNPVALASVTHDLGITYQFTDPHQARRQYLEAIEVARGFRDRSPAMHRESCSIEALAVLNLHDLVASYDLGLTSADLPPLADAERLAEVGWPELAHAIRAARAVPLLEAGYAAAARPLVEALPDPATMRDVVNAVIVVRAQAHQLELDGHVDEAVGALRHMMGRTPLRHVAELMGTLVGILERAGRFEEALDVSKQQVDVVHRLHAAEAKASVRALEVWFRTRRAEEDARSAHLVADRLRLHTERDVVTGLWNRARLEHLAEAYDASGDYEVAVVDIDRFKAVNDSQGHLAGDAALRAVADALRAAVDERDVVVRFGGDEFVVVRSAGTPGALADDLGSFLDDLSLAAHDVTASIGVAAAVDGGFDESFAVADARMYVAKRAGGGRVVAG